VTARRPPRISALLTCAATALAGVLAAGGPGESPGLRLAAAKPKAPGNFRVNSVDVSRIKLKWRDRARGERRYEVRHRAQATTDWTRERLKRNSTSFANGGLEPGTVHEHQVRACGRRTDRKSTRLNSSHNR
jgi:hypothetical protein